MNDTYEQDKILVKCHPTKRQLAVEQMEFYVFVHYGVNTYTDSEWGNGKESPSLINPDDFNPDSWVQAIKSAGAKGLIFTCKHHDGFCMWPSAYTEHSIKHSPYQNGAGDMVKEVADACRRGGIGFGIYLSPWDMNSPVYGQGKAYDDYFCNQLTELCTHYGEIFSVWFDGACGEGPNGKKQVYDWNRYYSVIRQLQPMACISISGPDIRWCGNEAGLTRESEWSVLPLGIDSPEEVAKKSQQTPEDAIYKVRIDSRARDLGSRAFLCGAADYVWFPAETDTSIRKGWFYHAENDDKVRSKKDLIDLWYRTVGGNSKLLLNVPAMPNGRFHPTDTQRLQELGDYLRATFAHNLLWEATWEASCQDSYHPIENVLTDNYDAYYKPLDGDTEVTLTVKLPKVSTISHIVLKEHIPMSQRLERYTVEAKLSDGTYRVIAQGTTIGYKKVCCFDSVQTQQIRIHIEDSRVCPILSFIGVY